MKKILTITGMVFGLILATNSYTMAQFKVGAGLSYGTEAEAIGVQVNTKYAATDKIIGAADLTIFFPDGFDWWELNINSHYNFIENDGMLAYGLVGLNYATLKFEMGQFGTVTNSEVGLNIGGGTEFGLGFANLFGEVRYVIGDYDQLVISTGLRLSF